VYSLPSLSKRMRKKIIDNLKNIAPVDNKEKDNNKIAKLILSSFYL